MLAESPTLFAHVRTNGAKITTTGVLLRNADMKLTAGNILSEAIVRLHPSLGIIRWTIRSSIPLCLTPSDMRKSRATVIIPLLEKPSRHSFGDRMPKQSISTTTVNKTNPGRILSRISAHTMKMSSRSVMTDSVGIF